MSIQDKIITLEKVLNTLLKIIEVASSVVSVILNKIESLGE